MTSSTHPDSQRWYSSGKLEFQMASSPKISGVDSYYYVFDREEKTIPQPNEAQRTTDAIVVLKAAEPGVWYFHAVVKDKAGNFSQATHFTVLLALGEMPPPRVSSSTHPSEEEGVNQHDPLFTWEDRHDGTYKPMGYVYKLSKHEFEKLTPKDEFTTEHTVQLTDIGEGTWYFHVASVGKKGKPGLLSSRRKAIIRRLGKVKGRFLRKDGTTPVTGAKVEMVKGEKVEDMVLTDLQGKFHFTGLPEGRFEIRLYSDQLPVLRLKDIPVTYEDGLGAGVFQEDLGLYPHVPVPGPIRFYYLLKEDCNVTLEVFDSTGTLVGKVEEKKEGGAYAVTLWDAAGKPEGEYLFKLSAKSITKNAISRFSVKKFKIQKGAKEGVSVPQPVS